MEAANANGVPVIIFTQPITNNAGTHPYANQSKGLTRKMTILGSLQIVFGTLCIICEVVRVVLEAKFFLHSLAFVGYGFWIGIFFIITGAFGCAGGRRNNRGLIITFNVLSIISAAVNVLLVILAAMSIFILKLNEYYYFRYRMDSQPAIVDAQKASIAMESLMIITAIAETIVAIWSSVVCCKVGACCCDCGDACCCPPGPVPTQVLMTQQPFGSAQQQPLVLYTTNVAQQPVGNVYQQIMVDPNNQSETDAKLGDYTRLCA